MKNAVASPRSTCKTIEQKNDPSVAENIELNEQSIVVSLYQR